MKKTVLLFAVLLMGDVYAADAKKVAAKPAVKAGADAKEGMPKGSRKKELNFEERVIEGLTGKGYESVTQTGNVDDGNRAKLYKKRADFDEETKNLLKEMEYLK